MFNYFVFVSYADLKRLTESKGFPGDSAGKESASNVGDLVLIAALGRFPGEGKGYQLQHSSLENSMDCIVHGVTKSDLRHDWVTYIFHRRVVKNQSREIEFILLGLADYPRLQIVIFLFLFLSYTLSLMGNVIIILLTLLDILLKTPMYFFLCGFSFLEIIFTTVCIPRYLVTKVTKEKTISYNNCAAQLFFSLLLGVTEFYLLAAMSYDRYVAIWKPPHYSVIMNSKVCYQLVLSPWVTGFLIIFPPLVMGL